MGILVQGIVSGAAMPILSISDLHETGRFVSAEMFGANAVFERTDDGRPTAAYESAASVLGVQNIRFGGGQADLDPARANSAGERPVDGETAINIVSMPNGALRPELVNFLDWVVASNQSGQPMQTTLIIPTKHLSVADYADFGNDISTFVQTVMQQYGAVISAFQIGNEHWEMGETAYGQKASIAAEAIEQGMEWAGRFGGDQADILVQMGTAGNGGSEFGSHTGGSYAARNEAANQQIINQLSADARDAIDGVTEHYYYNYAGLDLPSGGQDLRSIDRDYAVWDAAFSKELSLHITEWNIRTTAEQHQGIVAASTLVHQFENMIGLGADSAHIWTLDYHSRTALTLDTDNGVRLDGQGRLTNSAQGAVFDLMSGSLVGKELMSVSFGSGVPGIDVTAYASSQEVTLYVSSRAWEAMDLTLDLGALGASGAVTGVQVSLDRSSTNGLQWFSGEAADAITVDGAAYYYNEHDADVRLTDHWFGDASAVDLRLNPFEVVELTFALGGEPAPSPRQSPTSPEAPAPTPTPTPTPVAPVEPGPSPSHPDWLILEGGAGNVWGSASVDTLAVGHARGDVNTLFNGYGWAEIYGGALGHTVTLDSIERLAFDDGILALDIFGIAGEAYRLYQASFDRTPDQEGLAFWIEHLDNGSISLHDAAEAFLTSQEFEQAYGANTQLSDAAFLDLLYLNVLDRMPDQAGYAFWQDQQANGLGRADILMSFSESQENRDNVQDQVSDGIWFGF